MLLCQFALYPQHSRSMLLFHAPSTDVATKSCRPFNPIAWWPSCFRFTLLQWNQHLSIFALSMQFIIACALVTLAALSNVIPYSARWMNGKKKVIDAVNASKTQIQFILIIFSYCQFIPATTRFCFVISEMRLCRWKAMMMSRALKRLWLSEILMILVACRAIWFFLSSPASSRDPDWSYRIESSNLMQLIPTLLALPPHCIVNERSAVRVWKALD